MVCGIVAEYNPFHNGHLYQLDYVRNVLHADRIVVVMSGDYVQRGTPALFDKMTRTRMALLGGADLVLELPVAVSCASAEEFAYGAVSLLHGLGCVDTLCFGAECDDLPLLREIAKVFAEEPESYREALQTNLKEGMSFPSARMKAFLSYAGREAFLLNDASLREQISRILSSPNNILAIEYLKALQLLNSSISPAVLLRRGNGYHESGLKESVLPSATSIREALLSGKSVDAFVPNEESAQLAKKIRQQEYLLPDDFSDVLFYQLLSNDLPKDLSASLTHRIQDNLQTFKGYSSFASLLKTKDITQTAISRALLQTVLRFETLQKTAVPYARILGFRKSGSDLLHDIKKNTNLPLLSRMSEAPLDAAGKRMFEETIFASNLYEGMICRKSGKDFVHEYQKQIEILNPR